jgi:hypothetical protein
MREAEVRIVEKQAVASDTGERFVLRGFQTFQRMRDQFAPTFIVELRSDDGRVVKPIPGSPGEYALVDEARDVRQAILIAQ